MWRFNILLFSKFLAFEIKRIKIFSSLTSNLFYIILILLSPRPLYLPKANMPPSKRNRSATLAKSPPGSPIRPITKRSRQKTPEIQASSSTILPLPLRPTKISFSTATAFNSSQVEESESEEEARVRLIDESESEEEEEEEEEDDDITRANEYLDQDLKELGPDRLDREDIDESDIEKEVSEEFKTSKFFRQSIIDLEGRFTFELPSKEVKSIITYSTYFNPFIIIITNL